jgi:hypothetical protein
MRYILDTVLEHLPRIEGMEIHVIQKDGYNSSCTHDEFMRYSNLGNSMDSGSGHRDFNTQDTYFITVSGHMEYGSFEENARIFLGWLCRLAKRVIVKDIAVKFRGYERKFIIDDPHPYYDMWEDPSWAAGSDSTNWCEYLMWGMEEA